MGFGNSGIRRGDQASRVAVPGKQLQPPPVPGERVRIKVVRFRFARPELLRRFCEVDDRLALDLPFVTTEAPVAEVERLVDEDERARPASGRDGTAELRLSRSRGTWSASANF